MTCESVSQGWGGGKCGKTPMEKNGKKEGNEEKIWAVNYTATFEIWSLTKTTYHTGWGKTKSFEDWDKLSWRVSKGWSLIDKKHDHAWKGESEYELWVCWVCVVDMSGVLTINDLCWMCKTISALTYTNDNEHDEHLTCKGKEKRDWFFFNRPLPRR